MDKREKPRCRPKHKDALARAPARQMRRRKSEINNKTQAPNIKRFDGLTVLSKVERQTRMTKIQSIKTKDRELCPFLGFCALDLEFL